MAQQRGDPPAHLPRGFAFDLDGTLITGGARPAPRLLESLLRLKRACSKLILATGRCIGDINERFDGGFFDAIVAENGALVVTAGGSRSGAPEGWPAVRENLLRHFVPGCEEIIISSPRESLPLAERVVDRTRAQIVLNKDRLMIVPLGVDKGTGLAAALEVLGLKDGEVACLGDGENDVAMFRVAGRRYAIRNSVEQLKSMAEFVSSSDDGEGTIEVVNHVLETLPRLRSKSLEGGA